MSKDRVGACPLSPQGPSTNLQRRWRDLARDPNLKVPEEFHRSFKPVAVKQGVQMRDILKVIFEEYCEKHRAELGNFSPAILVL
jgi:hypothetical protein